MNPLLEVCYPLSLEYLTANQGTFRRYFVDKLPTSIQKHRLVVITGSRGVGKTTALVQYIYSHLGNDPSRTEGLYVPLDHFKLKDMALYDLGEAFARYGGTLLCVDEIHKYERWAQDLKSLCETFPKLKIIASGSSVLEIQNASHDLSRRALVEHVHGMSFREYLEFSEGIKFPALSLEKLFSTHVQLAAGVVAELDKKNKKVLACFKRYLEMGYYPYFSQYPEKELFRRTLEQQVHTAIDSDIPRVYPWVTGRSTKKITKLMAFLADSVPFIPNFKKLKELLDIGDERTLKHYLKMLEDAGLIQTLPKHKKGLKSLEDIGKIYLQNTNLQWALSTHPEVGTLRETFVMSMLQKPYSITMPEKGDLLITNKTAHFLLEIGGPNKNRSQIYASRNAYRAIDDIEIGAGDKIPIWAFGFLY